MSTNLFGTAGVDAFRNHHPDAGTAVLLVVPSEEGGAVGECMASEPKRDGKPAGTSWS